MSAYVDSSGGGSSGAALSFAWSRPGSAASGNLAICVIGASTNSTDITPPAGWAQFLPPQVVGTTLTFFSYYRVLDASDTPGTTYTFSSVQSRTWQGGISCYSGEAVSWQDGSSIQNNAAATAVPIPPVTTAQANDMMVAAYSMATGTTAATTTPPATPAFNERFDVSSSSGAQRATALADWLAGAAGTVSPTDATASTSGQSVAMLLAIAPSGATPPAAPTGLTATLVTSGD